ncbi:MAG: 4-(cytidine 5'-diphospho)-2-C-methyl-D-erythritol kinase [Phycisphaerales bacterium]|nr:4-(cytidine 5'-diphospho)-2-C-methyl-D-erythritol kinase [Phycisphaerales bacterium]
MPQSIHIQAPAKLNLALSVGPPDGEGMHPICSWMLTLDLMDEMELTALEPDRLSRYAILWHEEARQRREIDWSITSDLAVRAHLALERYVKRSLPIQMKLEKRIPLGGGLGGGSSDAAAMLRGVNRLFDLNLSDRVLEGIAASLGSDVPFLVRGGSAIVEGIGELIEADQDMPDLHAVLVFPEIGCDTGLVYRTYDQQGPTELESERIRALKDRPIDGGSLFNDLAAPALEVAPDLSKHQQQIKEIASMPVHVSGSGSTLFTVCRGAMESEALASAIESQTGLVSIPVSSSPLKMDMVESSA